MSRPTITHGRRDALEGAHRGIVHLEVVLRDVDRDDLECYLIHDQDLGRLIEYVRGIIDSRMEDGPWTN